MGGGLTLTFRNRGDHWGSYGRYVNIIVVSIPSPKLTYPLKCQFWRWFSFSKGGICDRSLEGNPFKSTQNNEGFVEFLSPLDAYNSLGVDGDSAGSSAGLELNEGLRMETGWKRAATKMPEFFMHQAWKTWRPAFPSFFLFKKREILRYITSFWKWVSVSDFEANMFLKLCGEEATTICSFFLLVMFYGFDPMVNYHETNISKWFKPWPFHPRHEQPLKGWTHHPKIW